MQELNEKVAGLLSKIYEKDESDPDLHRLEAARSACTRREGVITTLNKTGGVINRKYQFDSVDAGEQWKNLKVGKKVTVSGLCYVTGFTIASTTYFVVPPLPR